MAAQARITVNPVDVQVTPGGSPAKVHVEIFNAGNVVDQFWAGIFQGPNWLTCEPKMVSLFPGQSGAADLEFKIASGQVVPASAYSLTLRVVSAATRQVAQDQQLRLSISTVSGAATIRLEPQEVWGVHGAAFAVDISQSGNAAVNVELSGEEPAGVMQFQFDPPVVTVPPAGWARSQGMVSARAPYTGSISDHQFKINARGFPQPLSAPGTFHQSPVISPSRLRLISITLTALGGVIAIVSAIVLPWTSDGAGVYAGSVKGLGWTYMNFGQSFYPRSWGPVKFSSGEQFLDTKWLSGGSILIVLSVAAILAACLGRKKGARSAAVLMVILMLAFLLSVLFGAGEAGNISVGAILALIGGVIAVVGSLFVVPLAHARKIRAPKIPKAPQMPRIPNAPRF